MKNVKGYFKVDRNIFGLGLRPYCFIVYSRQIIKKNMDILKILWYDNFAKQI